METNGSNGSKGERQQQLREMVHRASLVIAHYWPMSGFVHHNPIRSLETHRFQDAIRIGRRFIGGRGYLSNEMYRKLVSSGRITAGQLDAAIGEVASDKSVDLNGRTVSHVQVLRTHLLEGISTPSEAAAIRALVDRDPNKAAISALAKRLDIKAAPVDRAHPVGRDMTLISWCDNTLNTQLEWLVNREVIKWCAAFLDEGHAVWSMPQREKGFYEAWKSLAAQEWSPCGIAGSRAKIAALPSSADDAVLAHLDALGIPAELRQDYLSLDLTSLCGWASFINWRAEHGDYPWQAAHPIDLVQYLAVRLFYEREIVAQTCRKELGIEGTFSDIVSHVQRGGGGDTSADSAEVAKLEAAWRLCTLAGFLKIAPGDLTGATPEQLSQVLQWLNDFPETEHGPVWLEALEAGYHEDLIGKLRSATSNAEAKDGSAVRPDAQLMFCIDVRSEPFRRHLESVGNYETIGFAGFFGIPMRFRALGDHHETDQLPAIVAPKYSVSEVVRHDQCQAHARHNKGKGLLHTLHEMLHDLKSHVLTPYITVEALGWIFGVPIIGRTIFPRAYRRWRERLKKSIAPPVGTTVTDDKDDAGVGLPLEDQATSIEMALRTMGLTKDFGRLVVICGHTSTSDNNPYEAALNCGACGGNSGKPNARLFAKMANKPHVREHLAKQGIEVPADTHFMGGLHDTTTDIVSLFDLEDLPDSHRKDLEKLRGGLQRAAVHTNRERCMRLPGIGSDPSARRVAEEIERRAGDWSETRPEWGLSSNASFIIGNRTMTQSLNLEGRAFLNSYDYRIDSTGALLEGILNGPMVVGQWINAEHYFSATDVDIYGSGSKIYHNVVGRIGIMAGPQSDLRTGLPFQSMMSDADLAYHEPMRLFVAIEAPRQRISEIVDRQPILKQLCDNEWIHLVAVDRESETLLYRYQPKQGWASIAA